MRAERRLGAHLADARAWIALLAWLCVLCAPVAEGRDRPPVRALSVIVDRVEREPSEYKYAGPETILPEPGSRLVALLKRIWIGAWSE